MKLIFVRHGEMSGDPFCTPERPVNGCLSPLGVAQAVNVRDYLRNFRIDSAYSSAFGRALQTAEIALAGRENLINVLCGIHEWMPDRNLEELPPTEFEAMRGYNSALHAEATWKTPLGEGCYDVYARVAPAVTAALSAEGLHMRHGGFVPDPGCEDRTVAFFAHGGSLGVMLAFLLGMRPFPVSSFGFEHCGVAEMRFSEHGGVWYPSLHFNTPVAG